MRFITLIIFLFAIPSLSAQDKCVLLKKIADRYSKGDLDSTLIYLQNFSEQFSDDRMTEEVALTKASVYERLGKFEKAKELYWQIIATKPWPIEWTYSIPECEEIDRKNLDWEFLRSMEFKQLKMLASVHLYEIFYNANQYDSAMYYLQLRDTAYDWNRINDHSYYNKKLNVKLQISDLYEKMGDYDKSIYVLVPNLFAKYFYASNTESLERLVGLFKKYKHINEIRDSVEHCLSKIELYNRTVKKTYQQEYDNNYQFLRTTTIEEYGRVAVFTFGGHQFETAQANDYESKEVTHGSLAKKKRKLKPLKSDSDIIEEGKQMIKNSAFYKLLME